MAREDEGNPEELGETRADVPGVRVVPVDQVRRALLHSHVAGQLIEQAVEVRPEGFFSKIAPRAEGYADDLGAVADRFERPRVEFGDALVVNLASDDVDTLDLRMLGKRSCLIDDVRDLPAGVRVSSELDVRCANQPVDGQRQDVETMRSRCADRASARVLGPFCQVPFVEREVRRGGAADTAKVRCERSGAIEGDLMFPFLQKPEAHDGAERVACAHRIDQLLHRRRVRFKRGSASHDRKRPLRASGDDDAFDGMCARQPERRIATVLERGGGLRGQQRELVVVEFHPGAGGQAPFDLVFGPPGFAQVDVDERRRLGLVPEFAKCDPALIGAKRERAVVEQTDGFFDRGLQSRIRMDGIPSLSGGDLEVVFSVNDAGSHPSGRMLRVDLHAVGHQVPAGHPFEDFATLGVIADRANHQGIRVETS